MSEDEMRILNLVEEVLNSGHSPEEVCRACPQLLSEVRQRVEECKQLNAWLEALFPPEAAGAREQWIHHLRQRKAED